MSTLDSTADTRRTATIIPFTPRQATSNPPQPAGMATVHRLPCDWTPDIHRLLRIPDSEAWRRLGVEREEYGVICVQGLRDDLIESGFLAESDFPPLTGRNSRRCEWKPERTDWNIVIRRTTWFRDCWECYVSIR